MLLWKSDESNSDFQCANGSIVFSLLEYPEEHSRQRNSSRYRKNHYLEEHDMEWHGDVNKNRDLKLIGINKILVSQFDAIYLRHSCKEFIQ
jgi:hypothetical protein